ncbi:methyltransferase family protein [Ulvibacterium sp.]|uniref:methyltransferase family protein n=1 Tax=Ulvibacterium sp. TaxID=2665914 RepID=UPI003CC61BA7
MKLKVPPVLVFLSFGLLMYLVTKFLTFGSFDFFGREYLISFLLGMAIIITVLAIFQFYRARTTVDPSNPEKASALVVTGLYKYSRNPMYLAMLLLLLALGLLLGNAFNTLVAAGFVAYMNRFQIIPEEQALLKIFGKAYSRYCIDVRRWF